MKFVLDANVLFSALIADSTTRALIVDLDHEYYTPQFVQTEIRKHRSTIQEKAGVSNSALAVLLDALFDELVIVPDGDIKPHLREAYAEIGTEDADDVPYLAAAMATNAAVWSDDSVFENQSRVEVYTTSEMVNEFDVA